MRPKVEEHLGVTLTLYFKWQIACFLSHLLSDFHELSMKWINLLKQQWSVLGFRPGSACMFCSRSHWVNQESVSELSILMSRVCCLSPLLSHRNAADGPVETWLYSANVSWVFNLMLWIYKGSRSRQEREDPRRGLGVKACLMTHLDGTPPGLWWHTNTQTVSNVFYVTCCFLYEDKLLCLSWVTSSPPVHSSQPPHTHTFPRWIIAKQSKVSVCVSGLGGRYNMSLLEEAMKVKLQICP